ncbi:MAG: SseB family protein [Mariniblastus sp.]
MNDALLAACQNENESLTELAAAILGSEFWLVNVSEPDQNDTSAMVIEIEGFPALVAFTSEDHAGTFAELGEDVPLNEEDELPCFLVDGKEFLTNLPKKFGIVMNPETEHSFVFAPEVARKIKKTAAK